MSKDTHRNNIPILRGEKHAISLKILHQPDSKPHAGSEIGEVPRSNHCATSISKILSGQVHYNEVSTQYIELLQHILSLFSRYIELITIYIKFTTQSIEF